MEDANRVRNGLVASGGRDSDKSSAHALLTKWL